MKPISARMLSKRTQLVWVAFFFAIPCALFVLRAGSTTIQSSVLLTSLASVDERPESDPIFETITSSSPWNSIVIHHLGQPAGDIETVDRDHAYVFNHGGTHAIVKGEYKIVREGRRPWALYHLAEDRTETNNIATKSPERVTEMATIWEKRWGKGK